MITKFRAAMSRKDDEQGFTLIELIVVMAILVILAAIAIPKYSQIRAASTVKADAATAANICRAARIQENETGTAVTAGTLGSDGSTKIDSQYMDTTKIEPQSGGTFALSGGGDDAYVVRWTPNSSSYSGDPQMVAEGVVFNLNNTTTEPTMP